MIAGKYKQMLIQFLIGLKYSVLIQEENQQQIVGSTNSSFDGVVLYSSVGDGANGVNAYKNLS